MRLAAPLIVIAFLLWAGPIYAQTGKIAGTVTDAETGDPLPGVNVIIEGQSLGATTDAQGSYAILNISPDTYSIRATFVGYADAVRQAVDVNIGLTSKVDFTLQEETQELEEVVVTSQEPIVKPDVSANVANLSSESIENMPVSSVEDVIGLQAGTQGLSIRGGDLSELNFQVDGLSMRSGRDNAPFTRVSYTSVKEIQVQTGGFNAEYGNVRSGLINVVTREGPRDHYTVDAMVQYSAPSDQYVRAEGIGPEHSESYWKRSYLDEKVAFVGTHSDESPWDRYTQRQYPRFEGWNAIAQQRLSDDNPDNDLNVGQLTELFKWYHRKDFTVTDPDYDLDMSLGGPVPGISDMLGDLRFFASYRQVQNTYAIPAVRNVYQDRTAQMKLTSDVAQGMKLQLQGLYSGAYGINYGYAGFPNMVRGGHFPGSHSGLYTNFEEPSDVVQYQVGGKFTHTLSSNTFYKVTVQRKSTDYLTTHGSLASDEVAKTIGSLELNEAPLLVEHGVENSPSGLDIEKTAWARDSSKVGIWSGRSDLVSQLNRYAQVKVGVEYIYNNYHTNHGWYNPHFVNNANPKYRWNRQPSQGAAYAQTKLEFEGMIANVGLRFDYFNPGGRWWKYNTYERAFSGKYGAYMLDEQLEKEATKKQFKLSPRVGISFPVTTNSKFFFNFGFFRQMLRPHEMFSVEDVGPADQVGHIGNPNHSMPTTVAYELGYEHNILNRFLLRLTGYYKDLYNQPRSVGFLSIDEAVRYSVSLPYNYEDIRGLEVTLRKNTGRWFRGFVNYTFMVRKAGNFGFGQYYQNRKDQRRHERESRAHYQWTPVPQPFARVNLEFRAPSAFGPELLRMHPLADWRLNALGGWRAGDVFTWSGTQQITGLENNVRWKDSYSLDLRLTKNVATRSGEVQLFAEVSNLLDLRQLNRWSAFQGPRDYQYYMQSLHLPKDVFEDVETPPYKFIPGNDQPGTYRKAGVGFVPIEVVDKLPEEGISRTQGHYGPLYYKQQSGEYFIWSEGSFARAKDQKVKQVLKDKAYIDMPNLSYFRFLNPRDVTFGMRISF